MIKFFKRLRFDLVEKNKTGKYLKYAIGEIVLVMIGILLALQINNWNEGRKARITEAAKLNKLVEDLKLDSTSFDANLKILDSIKYLHIQLYNIGIKGSNEEFAGNHSRIRKYVFYNPASRKNALLLVNQLQNEKVRKQLSDYLDRLEKIFITDNEYSTVVKSIREFLGQKGVYDLTNLFENKDPENLIFLSKEDLIEISKDKDFQQLLFEAHYKLKSSISELNDLINANDKLVELVINELRHY